MPGLNQSPLNSEQVVQGLDQLGAGSLQEQAIHKLLRTLSQNVIIHCRLSHKPSARIFPYSPSFLKQDLKTATGTIIPAKSTANCS